MTLRHPPLSRHPLLLTALVCVLAEFAVNLSPAKAEDAYTTCPSTGSTKLVTTGVLGSTPDAYKLWLYQSGNDTFICFGTTRLADGVVDLNTSAGLTPPTVTPTTGRGDCPQAVLTMTDPVALDLSVGASTTTYSLCLGVNGTATTLTFALGSAGAVPSLSVWLDGYTTSMEAYCWVTTASLSPPQSCWTSDVPVLVA